MKTILNENTSIYEIKGSKFITWLFKFYDNNDIDKYLAIAKEKYPKATHYCYAYITENYKKSSDDGEPGGTAGVPMLNVLEKEELINICAITIRYFGGIKLGAGGLVRAYTKSVRDSINFDNLIEVVDGILIKVTFDFNIIKELNFKFKDYNIIKKIYSNKVIYFIEIPIINLDILANLDYEIIEKRLICCN